MSSYFIVREISPKYVFGEKKYGRRTKPRDDSFILNQSEITQDLNSSIQLSPRKLYGNVYGNVSLVSIKFTITNNLFDCKILNYSKKKINCVVNF